MAIHGGILGREERWITHYSSSHIILLVGEGDFSFSLCLARAFASGANIVATSLDSYDELMWKYKKAKTYLDNLAFLGATLLHRVDATKMKDHPILQGRKFDRIIYNFPHAGFLGTEVDPKLIEKHRSLVRGFLINASRMLLLDGEIHVSHKVTAPYSTWRIQDLAPECSLVFLDCSFFSSEDYPGYSNKRGAGLRCDAEFPLGVCGTFKFKLYTGPPMGWNFDIVNNTCTNIYNFPLNSQQPMAFEHQHSVVPLTFNNVNMFQGSNSQRSVTHECVQIFGDYLNHAAQTFGSTDYDVEQSVRDALRIGFHTYTDTPGRSLKSYASILTELLQLSISRTEWLKEMLSDVDLRCSMNLSSA